MDKTKKKIRDRIRRKVQENLHNRFKQGKSKVKPAGARELSEKPGTMAEDETIYDPRFGKTYRKRAGPGETLVDTTRPIT